jgi:hypothetical protein
MQLKQDAHAIYSNIEWNLGCGVGLGAVILNPKLLNLQAVPLRIDVDGLSLDGFQCLGIALLEKDRQARANEVLGAVRRALICEGVELAADFLVRAARVMTQGADPYDAEEYFSVDLRELWNPGSGRAGSLITADDRTFLEHCAVPLRNCIRHNNGRLLPKKSIRYHGNPRGKAIGIDFTWRKESDNAIALQLSVAYDIFAVVREIVFDGLERASAGAGGTV